MIRLLRWVILRRLTGEPLRTVWTVLGVALGVAVFVGIRLASDSAMHSFADTVDAVAGRANLEVWAGGDGLDERAFPVVVRTPGVAAAAPAVQVTVRAHAGGPRPGAADSLRARWPETLLLLGVDPLREAPFARVALPRGADAGPVTTLLSEPRAVAVPGALARRLRLAAGDTLTVLASGRPEPLVVRAIVESEALDHATAGNVVVADIATAQEVLRRPGAIDRIDVIADPARRDAVRAALQRALPNLRVELPQGRTRQVENMVRAFRLNLNALSFIALFVAATLIFNAVAMSVIRLRREIGMLRALGLTRGGVRALFTAEGLAIGLTGAALGLALGTAFARGALGAVSRTLSDLYLVRTAGALHPSPATYATGLAVGIAVALASALLPAWEAAQTPPGVTMRQGLLVEAQPLPVGRWAALGLAALAAAAGVVAWAVAVRQPYGGFAAAFLVLAAFALFAPLVTRVLERAGEPLVRRLGGIEAALGSRYLRESVARASVVIAAVTVAVGMTVSLTLMVRSFRRTVDTWITQTIRGDLYVEPYGHRETGGATALPAAFVAAARAAPGVRAVDTFRGARIVVGTGAAARPAVAIGVDFAVQRDLGALRFVHGDAAAILGRALARGEAVVTESFAYHFRLGAGDTLALDVPAGRARLRIAGVLYDYSTDAGVVFVDRAAFARLWRDPRTESLALYLTPGADPAAVRSRLLALAGPDLVLAVTPNRALRERALQVFDQTFQVTWALQGIAVLVAVLGVIGTLTALVLQRGRELAVLRAIGATRRQVAKMVVVESVWIGAIGAVLGCACGTALALILVHVINRQFFGWTIRFALDPWLFVQAVAVVVTTAALAGLVPARLAVRRVAPEAMRAE